MGKVVGDEGGGVSAGAERRHCSCVVMLGPCLSSSCVMSLSPSPCASPPPHVLPPRVLPPPCLSPPRRVSLSLLHVLFSLHIVVASLAHVLVCSLSCVLVVLSFHVVVGSSLCNVVVVGL